MPEVNVTETTPDGTQRTYAENVTGSSRDEIDIYGSIVCSRFLANMRSEMTPENSAQKTKEAMDAAAKWSEENEKLIDEAIILGHEGEAVVNWVVAMNLKRVREESPAPDEVHAQQCQDEIHAHETLEPKFTRSDRYTPEPETGPSFPGQSYRLELPYERARVLAFWLRAQMREAVDDIDDRDLKLIASIVGADCKLLSPFEFNLNMEKPTDETEIPNPSDSLTA